MKKLFSLLKSVALIVSFAAPAAVITASGARAQAYDIDCKVILCLAGGFPQGCANAYEYMIDRITSWPPLPPFGFCAMSNGDEYTDYEAPHRFIGRGPAAFECPIEGTLLFYRQEDDERSFGDETAFCYTHTTTIPGNRRFDDEDQIVYHNRTPAQRVNFEIALTLEPGTTSEFRSPLFRVNTRTGFFSQRNR